MFTISPLLLINELNQLPQESRTHQQYTILSLQDISSLQSSKLLTSTRRNWFLQAQKIKTSSPMKSYPNTVKTSLLLRFGKIQQVTIHNNGHCQPGTPEFHLLMLHHTTSSYCITDINSQTPIKTALLSQTSNITSPLEHLPKLKHTLLCWFL